MKHATIFALAMALLLFCGSAFAAPSISNPKVTPATGKAGDTFTFTVRYVGEEPASVQLFILGETGLDMLEVDPLDHNSTDGKDYYLEVQLDGGTTVYYFKATLGTGDVRTPSATVFVGSAEGIRLDHLDVVFAVLVFLIPTVWGLLIFRRFSGDMKAILSKLGDRKKDSE